MAAWRLSSSTPLPLSTDNAHDKSSCCSVNLSISKPITLLMLYSSGKIPLSFIAGVSVKLSGGRHTSGDFAPGIRLIPLRDWHHKWYHIATDSLKSRINTYLLAEAQGFEPWIHVLAHILP